MTVEITCPGEADTRAVGRRLANLLRAGDVVLLAGDLGAGKTVFVSGVAEGLGVEERVVSPTFILARRYEGLMTLHHADLYRLGSSAEIEDLDLETDAFDGVLFVEWGNAADQSFGEDHLVVRIEVEPGGERRVFLEPHGSWEGRPLGEVAA